MINFWDPDLISWLTLQVGVGHLLSPFQPGTLSGPLQVLPLATNNFLYKAGMIENQLGATAIDKELLHSPVLNGNSSVNGHASNGVLGVITDLPLWWGLNLNITEIKGTSPQQNDLGAISDLNKNKQHVLKELCRAEPCPGNCWHWKRCVGPSTSTDPCVGVWQRGKMSHLEGIKTGILETRRKGLLL